MYVQGRHRALEKLGFDKSADIPGLVQALGDPATMAQSLGGLMAAKNAIMQLAMRHAKRIPGMQSAIGEIAGMGYRAGQAGRPLSHPIFRNLAAAASDNGLVGLYEMGHSAGAAMPTGGTALARGAIEDLKPYASGPASKYLDMISRVPTESKGFRRVLDQANAPLGEVARNTASAVGRGVAYAGDTPLSQVGRDIKQVAAPVVSGVKNIASTAKDYLNMPVGDIGRGIAQRFSGPPGVHPETLRAGTPRLHETIKQLGPTLTPTQHEQLLGARRLMAQSPYLKKNILDKAYTPTDQIPGMLHKAVTGGKPPAP